MSIYLYFHLLDNSNLLICIGEEDDLVYNITEVGKEIICGFAIIVFAVGILKVVISFLASPINVVCLSVGTQAVVVCL